MTSTTVGAALLFGAVLLPALRGQTVEARALPVEVPKATATTPESRTWFPHNWIRGFGDFGYAPPHNEPDLGRCVFPQPPSAGGAQSLCSAYARYILSGYIEMQPLNRTVARHLFVYFEPKFSFGDNVPQRRYTQSMTPIAFDRAIGVGYKLPKSFELRATQHQVQFLGRYSGYLGPAALSANGPYGLYSTVGARWYFGGYGNSDSR